MHHLFTLKKKRVGGAQVFLSFTFKLLVLRSFENGLYVTFLLLYQQLQ